MVNQHAVLGARGISRRQRAHTACIGQACAKDGDRGTHAKSAQVVASFLANFVPVTMAEASVARGRLHLKLLTGSLNPVCAPCPGAARAAQPAAQARGQHGLVCVAAGPRSGRLRLRLRLGFVQRRAVRQRRQPVRLGLQLLPGAEISMERCSRVSRSPAGAVLHAQSCSGGRWPTGRPSPALSLAPECAADCSCLPSCPPDPAAHRAPELRVPLPHASRAASPALLRGRVRARRMRHTRADPCLRSDGVLQGNSASSYSGSMPASGSLSSSLPLIKETDASPFVNGSEPTVRARGPCESVAGPGTLASHMLHTPSAFRRCGSCLSA